MRVESIRKLIGQKIGKSKIYEILNYYFYRDEFIEWVETEGYKDSQPLNGNFTNRWQYITKFDEVERDAKG